ncbi:hypothetical protein HYC85_003640 [Camellia sinensis]|uniref:DUF4220 domain-containing protein n=1 Tax=Camellia sinensis TaxID=4442 RepID=A0A7J7HV95_CAMSI|nr:hypothetical protein HYC85_003640 [Camellia sinensis]
MEAKWHEQHYSMVDIVITGVLLVGALTLEIYAVILLLFSDWAMLWLIKCGRGKWAILLLQKFPWFFEKKKWPKKMGQIDLLEEEDKVLRSGVKHPAQASLTDSCSSVQTPARASDALSQHLDTASPRSNAQRPARASNTAQEILNGCNSRSSAKTSARAAMKRQAEEEGRKWFPSDMIKNFIELATDSFYEKVEKGQGAKLHFLEAIDFFNKDVIIELVDEGNEVKWEKLKIAWLAMLCYAAVSCPKNNHLQQLKEGGELLNLVWFLIPQSQIFCGVDSFALNGFFNKYFQSMPDIGRARSLHNEGS